MGKEINKYRICIILVNYKNYKDTTVCIRSVKNSDVNELPFIVLVDNECDNSNLEDYFSFYPDIKILPQKENLGFAEGTNCGIRWALENIEFEFLFILNNDTVLKQDTLKELFSGINNYPDISIFTPCIITSEDVPRIWYAGGAFIMSKMTPSIFHIGEIYKPDTISDRQTWFASGCAILVSLKILNYDKDFFDRNLFIYDEDVEFSLRIHSKKEPVMMLSRAIVVHKCQGSQQTSQKEIINQLSPQNRNLIFYLQNTIPNRYYIINKHIRGWAHFKLNLSITWYWCLKSIQFLLHFKLKATITIYSSIIKYKLLSNPGKSWD